MVNTPPTQCRSVAWIIFSLLLASSLTLTACGSSNNNSAPLNDDSVPERAAEPTLTFHSVKTFRFSWSDVSDVTHYKLLENLDGLSGFSQVGSDVLQGIEHIDHVVPLYARTNALYILQSCTDSECLDSDVVTVSDTLADSIGYIKASNAAARKFFGTAVSISADGTTLAVGARGEESDATGNQGDQSMKSTRSVHFGGCKCYGAVYVFARIGNEWSHQAFLKASNADEEDYFGWSISLSADGNRLAVGAQLEDSDATGINGFQNNNAVKESGAVYMFSRSGETWSEQAYLKASNTNAGDHFGGFGAVSLSADGNTLVVGAGGEDSNATGINGDQSDNSAEGSGAVYVFTLNGSGWSQQAYLKASNTDTADWFGSSVSLSNDGNTLAVGAPREDSLAVGVNGNQSDNSVWSSGAVFVFTRRYGEWNQQAYLKSSNNHTDDEFGGSVSLNGDGSLLAVGAQNEDSSATGVNGDQSDNSAEYFGAVYLF